MIYGVIQSFDLIRNKNNYEMQWFYEHMYIEKGKVVVRLCPLYNWILWDVRLYMGHNNLRVIDILIPGVQWEIEIYDYDNCFWDSARDSGMPLGLIWVVIDQYAYLDWTFDVLTGTRHIDSNLTCSWWYWANCCMLYCAMYKMRMKLKKKKVNWIIWLENFQ